MGFLPFSLPLGEGSVAPTVKAFRCKSIRGWVFIHLLLCSCALQFKWRFFLPGVFPRVYL